jgi:hypothetical protein
MRVTDTTVATGAGVLWRFHPQIASTTTTTGMAYLSAEGQNPPSLESSAAEAREGRIDAAGASDWSYSARRSGLARVW